MPELPEVETVVRDLRPLLIGRVLMAVRVGAKRLRRPWQRAWSAKVIGSTVVTIRRRGKWIAIELASRGREATDGAVPPPHGRGECLIVHLGMTGQLTVVASGHPVEEHTHLAFPLDDGRELRFRDIRRFGSVEWFADRAAVDVFLAGKLGPEPFALDPSEFRRAIRGSRRPLKAILLDQAVVAGIGNIYADEALHRAGLHPERRGARLTDAEADRLREAIQDVLTRAIEFRGSTIRDYVGGSGLGGGFQREFRAYGRTGQPCEACGTAIAVARVAGRSSHFCPNCQPDVTGASPVISPGRSAAGSPTPSRAAAAASPCPPRRSTPR